MGEVTEEVVKNLGPLPKLHERFQQVQLAKGELGGLLCDWANKHDLTYIEEAKLLAQAIDDVLRYALREERHGTTDKRADEA